MNANNTSGTAQHSVATLNERQWLSVPQSRQPSEQMAVMYQHIDNYQAYLMVLYCMTTQTQQLTALLSLVEVSAALQATRQIHNTCTQCAANAKQLCKANCQVCNMVRFLTDYELLQ